MKNKKILLVLLGAATSMSFLSGCAAKALERELNVVFMNEGEIIDSGVITQFKNIKSPTISDSYVPTDYRFLGWTCYSLNELDLSSATNFKKQYIAGGRMVHYTDVAKFAENQTVVCEALIMHKDDIPKDYHYVVVAWYDKVATSGLDEKNMKPYQDMVMTYLTNQGVSQDDLKSVLFRPYTGNVGQSTGQIMFDGDVDIMFGWAANISTTGTIPPESVLEDATFVVPGITTPTRHIQRLSDSEGALKTMEFLKSEDTLKYFNPSGE